MNNFYDTISRDVNKAILENESQIFELKKEEIINQKLKEKDKEIERLNENNQAMQEELCKVWGERDNAYRRILEAIDNLENPYFVDCEQQCKDVINILKGEDKE